jgi:hypothetical protein
MGSVEAERWYSVKEVSEFLGWSADTVVRQIRRGFLKAFILPGKSSMRRRVYQCRRVQGSEIMRYVREHVA